MCLFFVVNDTSRWLMPAKVGGYGAGLPWKVTTGYLLQVVVSPLFWGVPDVSSKSFMFPKECIFGKTLYKIHERWGRWIHMRNIYIYNTPWFGIPAPQVLMSLEGPLQPHHELVTGCYLWEVGNLKLQRAFGELNDVDWCERRLWTIGVLKKQWLNNSLNLGVVTIVYVFVVDILLLLPLTKIQDLQIAAFLKQLWIPAGQVDSGKLVRWQEGGADLTVPRCPKMSQVEMWCLNVEEI